MKPATGKTAEKAKHGRNGDRFLAHINPMEAAILKAMGGAGTTNPKTGYKEYYSEADAVGAGDFSSEPGLGTSPGLGGSGSQDPADAFSPDRIADIRGELSRERVSQGYAPLAGFEGSTEPLSTTPMTPASPPKQGALERAINSTLTTRVPNPVISPTGFAAFKGAQALGEYVGKPLNDMFGGNAKAEAPQFESSNMGAGGANNDYFNQSIGIQPVAASLPAFMRPPEEPAPPAFGMAGGMTDLQKRAQIATGGTQGSSGQFRTPDAMRYYGNLIARALIGDNNAVSQQSPNLLPIEDTYLKQVFGVTPQNNSAALLDALKPYWSR